MADSTTSSAAHLSPMPVGRDTGGPEIAWRPSPDYLERSRLRRFMAAHRVASCRARRIAWYAWEASESARDTPLLY